MIARQMVRKLWKGHTKKTPPGFPGTIQALKTKFSVLGKPGQLVILVPLTSSVALGNFLASLSLIFLFYEMEPIRPRRVAIGLP